MVRHVAMAPFAARASVVLVVCAALSGCSSTSGRASADGPNKSCPATVLDTLGRVLARVYHEGVFSERTASARHMIGASLPLRAALEAGDPAGAKAAAAALIATGHMTNLRIMRGRTVLADLGGPALTPLHGTIADAHGKPIGSYLTSVWSQAGFIAEGNGIGEGVVVLRKGERSIGGTPALPGGGLGREGSLSFGGVPNQYRSFAGETYPAGAIRIYLLKPISSTTQLCGASGEDTVVNTLSRIANLIYAGEAGHRTLPQVRRVQRDPALLAAVARRDPVATRAAAEALLHHHLVRLRVSGADGRLLVDDGGPFVLAPVRAKLRLHGHAIGSFVLSIQDDEGYKRLTQRLVGLRVLMYMNSINSGGPRLVKNSLGPSPGNVPASGSYSYHGQAYRVFTVNAQAFPSGPLTIRVLVPVPYR